MELACARTLHRELGCCADFNIDRPADPFRPYGSLVGHWFEWARLVLQLSMLPGSNVPWAPEAAAELFHAGVRDGWDEELGGFVYSVDFDGNAVNTNRMHWVMAEAIGAAVFLGRHTADTIYEAWYRRVWSYINDRVIDRDAGGWWHELDARGNPSFETWPGKPDLYHALQATLYARADYRIGLVKAARSARIR